MYIECTDKNRLDDELKNESESTIDVRVIEVLLFFNRTDKIANSTVPKYYIICNKTTVPVNIVPLVYLLTANAESHLQSSRSGQTLLCPL